MRPHSDSCRSRCCCRSRKLLLLRGWLCGIPEWNNSQEREPQHGCLPHDPPLSSSSVAAAICLLCRISWAASMGLGCQLFLLHHQQQQQQQQHGIRSSNSVLGSSSGPKCHSNSLLRFIFPHPQYQDLGQARDLCWGWSWRWRWWWGWAWPLLPECALVKKIYCEDARVSWSWEGGARSWQQVACRSRFHFAGLRPKKGNWVCFSISRTATWPQSWQATAY